MKKKHRAVLLLDDMLAFFVVLQAVTIIPLCIIPTQQNLSTVQQQTFFKLACWQKLQHPNIQELTLKNQHYTFQDRGAKLEVYQQKKRLEYDRLQKTFCFFTE